MPLITRSYRFTGVDQRAGIRTSFKALKRTLDDRDTTIILHMLESGKGLKVLLVVAAQAWHDFCNHPDDRYHMFIVGLESLGLEPRVGSGKRAERL